QYPGIPRRIDDDMQRFLRLVSFFVTTPVVLYAAQPFFKSAWRGVAAGMPGMDLPVSIAIGAAYVASVYSTFTNGAAVWFDSVTMFVFFLTLGRFLEMRARHRSIDRSVALSQLIPNTATRIDDGALFTVPVSQLAAGDTICIRPGDSVPADGRIIDGATSVDESLLTGESEPQPCIVGDLLAAGSVNIDGAVYMLVTQTGNDTALGSIARMSRRARYARPSFVQTADRVASYIVIALLLVAAAVATYWSFVDPERAFVITLSVLVVTCPCALALATPAAFATAGARMAQLHLLVTDGNAIESLSRATHLVFDKTGTLTTGRPQLQATHIVAPDFTASECLQYAAVLEAISSHPISHAFPPQEELPTVDDARVVIGQGVSGRIAGHEWRIGNAAFTGVTNAPVSTGTTVFLARDNDVIARFDITDELRSDANDVLATLRRLGFGITLASGDNEHAVSRVAKQLSIDNVQANCAPAEKLALIRRLQDQGEHVVMIGDGINDAPVLAGADASISFAHGALLAQTSADVIALGESLQPVVTAHRISKRTMQIVRQNLAWAIAYNLVALPLAAAGYVPPWAAAIGMSASSLIVVLNALRLNRYT
ncbi:MAG: heavy metal translocating P-type ATPase, partial [Pseudomonadota bacterium]